MEEVLHQWEEELGTQLATMENACENHHKDWTLLVANEKKFWKELQVAQGKVELLILQTVNDWETWPLRTKQTTLYDEFVEQLPIKMGELLEEIKEKFKRWHFEQTRKYTGALHHKFIGFIGLF
jgi:hypothetical protein